MATASFESPRRRPPAWTLDTLAHAAWPLEPPFPREKKAVLQPEAAHLVDSLLARVARGRGALDVTIGAALASLSGGDRVLPCGRVGPLQAGASKGAAFRKFAGEIQQHAKLSPRPSSLAFASSAFMLSTPSFLTRTLRRGLLTTAPTICIIP
jgi:hypothetical protein